MAPGVGDGGEKILGYKGRPLVALFIKSSLIKQVTTSSFNLIAKMPKAVAKEPTKWTVIDVTGMPKSAKENKILKKFEEVKFFSLG